MSGEDGVEGRVEGDDDPGVDDDHGHVSVEADVGFDADEDDDVDSDDDVDAGVAINVDVNAREAAEIEDGKGAEYDGDYNGHDADVTDAEHSGYEDIEGDGEDYADVVDDGDVCEACYVGLDARVDVEDAGADEAGDEGGG